jgi:apolipoprotein N-acyltransferase
VGDRATRLTAAAAFALLLMLAFPFRAGELRFDVGLIAGWLVLIPFALMLRGLRPGAAFAWGTVAGLVGYAGVVFWLFVVVTVYGHAPIPVGVLAVGLMGLYMGLHAGLAAALVAWLAPRGKHLWLVLPAAWLIGEHLRSFDLWSGFPWAYLGYSQHANGPILQLASLGGVWAISLLIACVAGLAAEGRWRLALAVWGLAHGLGFGMAALERRPFRDDVEPVRAALVQASIPQDLKWDRALTQRHFDAHVELSRLAAAGGPLDLIVWPESAVPVALEVDGRAAAAVEKLARETGATLILGGMGLRFHPGRERPDFFGSVFVVDPQRGVIDRYDKTRLVPFGEYVPMRGLLGFLSGVATGLAGVADVTPGERPRALVLGDAPGARAAPAALICYEVIYPVLVREAVRDGAGLLLNVTNDAWYGRTSAPHQFFAIAAMRSAEHGLPMLRVANTGVSGVVDAFGRPLEQTPIFERKTHVTTLPEGRGQPTLYTRLGDWIVWLSWAIVLGFGGVEIVRRAGRSEPRDP